MKNETSIIIDDLDTCYLCEKPATDTHHCLFGNARKFADKNHLIVGLCRECHRRMHNPRNEIDKMLQEDLKVMAQIKFEDKIGTREEFIKGAGRSYL